MNGIKVTYDNYIIKEETDLAKLSYYGHRPITLNILLLFFQKKLNH